MSSGSGSSSIRKKEKGTGIGIREGRGQRGGGESKSTHDDSENKDKGIAHLERSLRSLLLRNDDDNDNNNDDDDSIEIKTNRVLKLALESIERQQWRHIDELNFLDAAENSFPDLNVYKMKMNNDVNDVNAVNDVNDDITSIERENDDTLDLLLSQYGRIIYKMNELKHLDTSRAKNLHAISKEVDDINTRKGKAYTLKQVLNISVKPNNKDKFQTSPMKHNKDKKSMKQNSNSSSNNNNSSLSIENQIAALRDAESKALESRRNEYKFWTILDRNLSKYDTDNSKAPVPSTSSKAMKELEGAIGGSGYLDMLGTLEEAVQNFMIAGQISYQDMQRISSKVNSDICSDIFERSTKLMNDSEYYDTKNDNEDKGNKVDNDYINIDVNSVMYRYLQSQWKVPYRDVNPALETLRGRHKDMLLKIAKATQPHSPYEFVFNNNQK